jgi:hypothetical protein
MLTGKATISPAAAAGRTNAVHAKKRQTRRDATRIFLNVEAAARGVTLMRRDGLTGDLRNTAE